MKCLMCKGSMKGGFSTFMVDVDNCIIAIRNVPSDVCDQCGQETYNYEISKQLEEMVNKLKAYKQEVAVVDYKNMVA